jgi:cation diffusion facilitator family transporter
MQKRTVALLAILGGVGVFALKIFAFLLSGSVALLSDALESIINIVASLMVYVSVSISGRPNDRSHNYGHQKIENLTSFMEGILILIAALLIAETAIGRLGGTTHLTNLDIALAVSLTATALNGLLSYLLMRTSKKTDSLALEGDAKHLLSDVLSTIGVLIGLAIVWATGWVILDPIMALLVAALIVKMGVSLILKSSKDLMDQSSPEVEEKIVAVLVANKALYIEYHDLKTRKSGGSVFAELHLCVDSKKTIAEAHEISDLIEKKLRVTIPNLQLIMHIETDKEASAP